MTKKRKASFWLAHLWQEWTVERRRPIAPAFARPLPWQWSDDRLTAAWLGHSTVLLNFFGVWIITDPALFPRIGIYLGLLTLGPKRLTAPALTASELPPIDVVLLSHAHFDHWDIHTLRQLRGHPHFVVPQGTLDLLPRVKRAGSEELKWNQSIRLGTGHGDVTVRAFRVKHWGARMEKDTHRGYSGYIVERGGKRIIFSGDTAYTESFAELRDERGYDLAIIPVGAYQPWIRAHCTPEEAIRMADAAGARFLIPVHHQTFRLSFEPFREPIERFVTGLAMQPDRIALREIGETFVLPP